MQVNPVEKSVSYSLEKLADVQGALDEIERKVLDPDTPIKGLDARHLCGELNNARRALGLRISAIRNEQFEQG